MRAIALKNKALKAALDRLEWEDYQGTCGCTERKRRAVNKIHDTQRMEMWIPGTAHTLAECNKHNEQARLKARAAEHEAMMKHCSCYRGHHEIISQLEKALQAQPKRSK